MKKKSNSLSLIVGLGLSFFFFFVVVKRIISKNMSSKKLKEDDARKAEMAKRVYTGKSSPTKTAQKPVKKSNVVKKTNSSDLSQRESKIMDLFNSKSDVSMEDLQGVLDGVTVRTIRRDLTNLAKKKLIKKVGKTKGSTYVAA